MPYCECKMHLKSAVLFATEPQLKAIALYNLSVLNYVEISEHNERVLNPASELESQESMEQLQKMDKQRKEKDDNERFISAQVKKDEKLKMMKQRQDLIKEKLRGSAA